MQHALVRMMSLCLIASVSTSAWAAKPTPSDCPCLDAWVEEAATHECADFSETSRVNLGKGDNVRALVWGSVSFGGVFLSRISIEKSAGTHSCALETCDQGDCASVIDISGTRSEIRACNRVMREIKRDLSSLPECPSDPF